MKDEVIRLVKNYNVAAEKEGGTTSAGLAVIATILAAIYILLAEGGERDEE